MKHSRITLLASSILLGFAASVTAEATAIDFELQVADRGGNLTGIPDAPLIIGPATFTGGELLNGEAGLKADGTGVYASEGLFGSGETNPIMIAFAAPVQVFSAVVLNGQDASTFTVSDNLGDAITQSLPSTENLGAATFSLAGSGVTSVAITSANGDAWNFAIDNVTFTQAAITPEPIPPLLVGLGFVLLLAAGRIAYAWRGK
jgi:hypothetical protein